LFKLATEMCLKCEIPARLEKVEEEKHTLTDGEYLKKMNILKKLYDSLQHDPAQACAEYWKQENIECLARHQTTLLVVNKIFKHFAVVHKPADREGIIQIASFRQVKNACKSFTSKVKEEYDVDVGIELNGEIIFTD